MSLSAVDKAEARSSVELTNSCNCNQCCPRSCGCWPRRVVHKKPVHENPTVDPHTITRTHTVSLPVLKETGEWEVEIDGKKHSLSENAIGESIKQEHGIPK